MKFIATTLVFFVISSLVAIARDQEKDIAVEGVRSALVGKVVTLRGFYSANQLRYNADGQLISHSETCPWTLCGDVSVNKLEVSDGKLRLRANRVWVFWEQEKQARQIQYIRAPDEVTIEAELDPSLGDSAAAHAVNQMFLSANYTMYDAVPDLWKCYFAPPGSNECATPPARVKGPPPQEPQRIRVSQDVIEGHLKKKVMPTYPELAKKLRLQGTLILETIIGKDGAIQRVRIKQPLGMGMDESAAEAVSQWRFTPYLLMGKPVEVHTTITVNYTL